MLGKLPILPLYPFQSFINRYLQMSPDSEQKLVELEGKVIKLSFEPIKLSIYMKFHRNKVVLTTEEQNADTELLGTPLGFMQMTLNQEAARQALFNQSVHIKGDAQVGQKLQSLINDLDIDWEEHLSHYIGDIPAHFFGELFREAKQKFDNLSTSMQQNMGEYLQEELRYLPTREEINNFFDDIHQLRLRGDRTQAAWRLVNNKKTNNETN